MLVGWLAAGELAAGWWMLVGCWPCGWKRAGGKADRRLLESWLLAAGCWSDAGCADGNEPENRRIGGCWRAGCKLLAVGELAAGWWMLVGCWLCGWKRAGGKADRRLLESWLLAAGCWSDAGCWRLETCWRIGGSEAAGELAAAVGCWRAGCWLVDAGELAAGWWMLESWLQAVGCWRAGC
jgi:hypothetical protein